jgi:hypothetical protein
VILACALAAIVIAAAGAEAVTRDAVDSRIAAAAREKLSGPVSAGIGLTPALLDAATGHIPAITITAPSTSLCTLHDIGVTATLTDVRRSRGTVTAQNSRVSVVLTPAALAGPLAGRGRHVAIAPDPAARSLVIALGAAGAVRVDEHASLSGNAITLSPASVSLLGRPLALTPQITHKLTIRRALPRLPLGLAPKSTSVTSGGLQINLYGGPTIISPEAGSPHACAKAGLQALRRRGGRCTRGHPTRQATPLPPIRARPLSRPESK